ncbi:hypothetical protein ACFYNO_39370 [Kitasatospora sp. NPDC006697]|uniref:hypothetical protein n=1 Tax=Kitasatospora sp. NPDC006697 TaxID=3364020 RepID=UPI0036982605
MNPVPVGFDDYESQSGINGLAFGSWVNLLEKDFATAIVQFERTAGAAGALPNGGPTPKRPRGAERVTSRYAHLPGPLDRVGRRRRS